MRDIIIHGYMTIFNGIDILYFLNNILLLI
jgi:hypothetical protein